MGAGKTTIGKHLAQHLKLGFADTDSEIEARTGADIPWIFDVEGEEGFRDREQQVVEEMTGWDDMVLATGGGVVLRQGGAGRADRRTKQETHHADDVRARSALRVAVEADAAAAAAVGVEHGHGVAADGENVVDDSTLLGQHCAAMNVNRHSSTRPPRIRSRCSSSSSDHSGISLPQWAAIGIIMRAAKRFDGAYESPSCKT